MTVNTQKYFDILEYICRIMEKSFFNYDIRMYFLKL